MIKALNIHPADVSLSMVLSAVTVDACVHLSEIYFKQDLSLFSGDPADTRFSYQKKVHLPVSVKIDSKSYRFDYVRSVDLRWSLEEVHKDDSTELLEMFGVYGLRQLKRDLCALADRTLNDTKTAYGFTVVDRMRSKLLTSTRSLLVRTYNPQNNILQLHALDDGTYVCLLAQKKGGEFEIHAVRQLVYREEIRDILSLIKGYKQMGNENIAREFMFMFEIMSSPELDPDLFLEDENSRESVFATSGTTKIDHSPAVI